MKYLFPISLFLLPILVNAQTECDSLDIISISYSPFTDSLIVVSVENSSSELFDYPGFVLIDSNGDTVAKESVNYFGIAGQSVHSMVVREGVHDPLLNFEGQLELFTGFFSDQACTWSLDQGLCASDPCDSLIITFQNWGGALVLGDFDWSVLDSTDAVVQSGTFNMDPQLQYWQHGFCLTPGTYRYTLVAQGEPSGGGPVMTVSSSSQYAFPFLQQYFNWEETNVMEVPFFLHCIDPNDPNGLAEGDETYELKVLRNGNQITLSASVPIRSVEIFSLGGKSVFNEPVNTDQFHLPMLPNGLYIVKATTDQQTFASKLFFGN
jgi:hypothetical protein